MSLGLVLGGGGARGFAHIGVLRVLEQEGFAPDVVAGTSMGALIGAFLAAGHPADEILRAASGVPWASLLDFRPGAGLLRASGFEAFLAAHLPRTFEELRLPLVVTATDVLTGRLVFLSRGELLPALRATSAYPGAVDPVRLEGLLLADGGILNQVPVDGALFLGATKVLAVDVTAPPPLAPRARRRLLRWHNPWGPAPVVPADEVGGSLSPVRALTRALDIMQTQLTEARLSLYRPDLVLRPALEGVDLMSFRRLNVAVEAGEAAAQAASESIRALAGRPASESPHPSS